MVEMGLSIFDSCKNNKAYVFPILVAFTSEQFQLKQYFGAVVFDGLGRYAFQSADARVYAR